VGVGGIRSAPLSEGVQSQSVSTVQGNDRTNFPVAHRSVQYRIQIMAELLATAQRELISNVACKYMPLVKEARTPVRARIVNVLGTRLATRAGCARTTPTCAEVSGRVAQALRIGISNLALQPIAHALLQHG